MFSGIYFCNHDSGWEYIKKSEICRNIWAKVLLEDAPTNDLDCAGEWIKVLLFEMPWNKKDRDNKNIIPVKNWKDIIEAL